MKVIVKDLSYCELTSGMPLGPGLNIGISNHKLDQNISALAAIDSGADITCISEEKIKQLEDTLGHPLIMESVEIVDSSGKLVREKPTYLISLTLGNEHVYIPENGVLLKSNSFFGNEDVLIGREVLNGLKVILNGPCKALTMKDPRP